MKRFLFILTVSILACSSIHAQSLDEKLQELDNVMNHRNTYYMKHEHSIDSLKKIAASIDERNVREKFDIYHKIHCAYRSYQNDSARIYADKALELANRSGNKELVATAKYDNAFTYVSKGDFTHAIMILNETDLTDVSDSIKAEIYVLSARLYSDLSNFTSDIYTDSYAYKSKELGLKALSVAKPGSYTAQLASFFHEGLWQNRDRRIVQFNDIINRPDVETSVKAMYYSILGDLYIADGQTDKGLMLKAQSAILDIQSATRETTSKHFLAYKLLEKGDVNRASKYIHVALEDAENYNAPQRIAEIGQALSLIEASRYNSISYERNMLWVILVISLTFIVVIGILFIYIHRQNRKLKASQTIIGKQNEEISTQNSEIKRQNGEISEANDKLKSLNSQLQESIKIKDEYIGYVFYLISEYIKKIETIYKLVNLKLTVKQPNDLKRMLPVSDIRIEKEKMLKEFDRIFLSLFPSFIEQYQELFNDDKQQLLASADGILTPEMRIFALIRLGVTDSASIAQFLNYSVNTINTYKTKAKNRSLVSNDEFESRIMQIRSVK